MPSSTPFNSGPNHSAPSVMHASCDQSHHSQLRHNRPSFCAKSQSLSVPPTGYQNQLRENVDFSRDSCNESKNHRNHHSNYHPPSNSSRRFEIYDESKYPSRQNQTYYIKSQDQPYSNGHLFVPRHEEQPRFNAPSSNRSPRYHSQLHNPHRSNYPADKARSSVRFLFYILILLKKSTNTPQCRNMLLVKMQGLVDSSHSRSHHLLVRMLPRVNIHQTLSHATLIHRELIVPVNLR